jgi:hypothetical protein
MVRFSADFGEWTGFDEGAVADRDFNIDQAWRFFIIDCTINLAELAPTLLPLNALLSMGWVPVHRMLLERDEARTLI